MRLGLLQLLHVIALKAYFVQYVFFGLKVFTNGVLFYLRFGHDRQIVRRKQAQLCGPRRAAQKCAAA